MRTVSGPWGREVPPEFPRRDPYHRPPGLPRSTPGPGEGVDPWLRERLFDRRLVMVHGLLTPDIASSVAAQLLALDITGDGRIQMHLACPDGDLGAVFTLVDTLDMMRVPVSAVVTGELGGAALGVLAAARQRAAYPHAQFRLVEPRVDDISGTADEIVGQAGRHLQMLEDLVLRLAEVTGRSRSEIEHDLSEGRMLSADQAVEYGLIQEVLGPAS